MRGRVGPGCLAVVFLLGCGDVRIVGPTGQPTGVARQLAFEARADGSDGTLLVSCEISTAIDVGDAVESSPQRLLQSGSGGGDAKRRVTRQNGDVVQFWAHTQFENIEVHRIGADSIEIRSPASTSATERFWREFSLFAGNTRPDPVAPDVIARGTWTCRPMDTLPSSGEYYDPDGSVTGTWILKAR